MLLQDRMKQYPFSPSEQLVINFIIEKGDLIKDYSAKAIALETFTSPSILIRIAKKLDYSGWSELKESYLAEIHYLNGHFQSIDANLPFGSRDSLMAVATKIGQLHTESIQDTLSLISHDSLAKAIRLMEKSKEIKLFSVSNLNYAGQEFIFKMDRIQARASINSISDNLFHDAAMTSADDCAICISYSGETPTILKASKLIKENSTPIIAITSFGDNRLSRLADVVLPVTTREKAYSKIAGFSSLESISLLLNILYAGYFSINYEKNLDFKIKIAEIIENNRDIENVMIQEE